MFFLGILVKLKNYLYLESNEDIKLRISQRNKKVLQMSGPHGFDLSLGKFVSTLNLLVTSDG